MGWFTDLTGFVAPLFIIASPILSYSDQALSMQRNKSSAGFSLDIPLIMLVASFLRIFYWPGARFDVSLLVQSLIMVGMQMTLLKVALDHRPPPSSKGGEVPFAGAAKDGIFGAQRPYSFWQWRSPKPYWQFLMYLLIGLLVCEIVLGFVAPIYDVYSSIIGVTGLAIEATLPMPQILSNFQSRSCKGFRLSVLISWLAGDAMKMFWFFTATSEIPWAFKICGMFQACCDSFLGVQYLMYGDGVAASTLGTELMEKGAIKEHPIENGSWQPESPYSKQPDLMRAHSRSLTPTRRPAPFQKDSGIE